MQQRRAIHNSLCGAVLTKCGSTLLREARARECVLCAHPAVVNLHHDPVRRPRREQFRRDAHGEGAAVARVQVEAGLFRALERLRGDTVCMRRLRGGGGAGDENGAVAGGRTSGLGTPCTSSVGGGIEDASGGVGSFGSITTCAFRGRGSGQEVVGVRGCAAQCRGNYRREYAKCPCLCESGRADWSHQTFIARGRSMRWEPGLMERGALDIGMRGICENQIFLGQALASSHAV